MRGSDAPGWSSLLPATEAAKALRDGAYLPSEYVRDVLASAASRIPEHRAFVEIHADRALRDAGASDRRLARGAGRPLEGVAFAVKDVIDFKGHRTQGASQSTAADPVASADAEVVTQLRDNGAVFDALVTVTTQRPPAIAVPISLTAKGLPLSMQLVGARGADCQLLALARACEQGLGGRVQRLTARRP